MVLCYGQDASLDPALLPSSPVREALAALAETNIPTVIALPAPASTSLNPLLLHDRYGDARHAFATSLNGISCASVDHAGFVRHLEAIEDATTLTPLNFVSMLKRASQKISPDSAAPLQVGTRAPAFACRDMNGQMRRLSELRGKRHLLLTFFPKCFTSHCTSQLSSLRDSNQSLQAAGVEVWAVSVDPADGKQGQRAFAKSLNLPFPLLPDVGRNLSILYGAANSPNQLSARMSVLIDKQGVVRWIDKQINVKTHGQDVLAKVQELKLNELNQQP